MIGIRKDLPLPVTSHVVLSAPLKRRFRIALVADLHNEPYSSVAELLVSLRPDYIAVAGDLLHWRLAAPDPEPGLPSGKKPPVLHALGFLYAAAQIAPTYYSLGNHELGISRSFAGLPGQKQEFDAEILRSLVTRTGVRLLHNAFEAALPGIWFGGLSSGRLNPHGKPDMGWLAGFAGQEGYKILLCHHPEYYSLIPSGIDLILSGHAHGGQWRLFGRGLFAPGQGLFPRYTEGFHHGRMLVSRGLANTAALFGQRLSIPRLNNPPELVVADLEPSQVPGFS